MVPHLWCQEMTVLRILSEQAVTEGRARLHGRLDLDRGDSDPDSSEVVGVQLET